MPQAQASKPSAEISILIVDPSPEERAQVSRLVLKVLPQAIIIESEDGFDALSYVSRNKFDLLITNVKLPKMDGVTMIRSLKDVDVDFRPRRVLALSLLLDAGVLPDPALAVTYSPKPVIDPVIEQYLRAVFLTAGAAKKSRSGKIDAAAMKLYSEGMVLVLKGMGDLDARLTRISVRMNGAIPGDIGSVIPLNCHAYSGQMVIAMSRLNFLKLASSVFGEAQTEVSSDNRDLICEMSNQVYGHAKRFLNDQGYDFPMAFPKLVSSQTGAFPDLQGAINLSYFFEADAWNCVLELQLSDAPAV